MWKTLKNRLWRWRGILVVVPSITVALIGLRSARLLQVLELSVLDLFFLLRPAEPADQRVVVVEINETDVDKYGYPISDSNLVQLLTALNQQKPRAIGLGLYRDLKSSSASQELVQVFQSTPNMVGLLFGRWQRGKFELINVDQTSDLEQVKFSEGTLQKDKDGAIRRHLLYFHSDQGQAVASLGFALALRYLKAEGVHPVNSKLDPNQILLGKAVFEPLDLARGGYIRDDLAGYQLLSNFRNLKSGLRTISVTDVLDGRVPKDFARDRIVLIGDSVDAFRTPYSNDWFGQPLLEETSPVMLHADFASQIISAALEGRPLFQAWPERVQWLWILVWSTVGATIIWAGRYH